VSGVSQGVRALGAAALVVAFAGLGAACGGDDDGGGLSGGAAGGPAGDAATGAEVAEDKGCTGCHSSDGSDRTGPSWQGIWGTEVTLEDGDTAVVDREYVERSIREPRAQIVDGYSPVMPEPDLDDDEVDALVAYIEALGDGGTTSSTGSTGDATAGAG
jgi:cytochrome c oxidase subunit 2